MNLLLRLLALATVLLGSGCASLSHAQRDRAEAIAVQARSTVVGCQRADRCAQDSPLRALAGRAFTESTPEQPRHYATLLDEGEGALVARLNLLRSATRSIDLQTYIFDKDDSARLVIDELLAASRRGVKVRVLIDQLSAISDLQILGALSGAHQNFQLRVYNPTFGKARLNYFDYAGSVLCCFRRFNQRMHNKLLVIDDAIGVVGGRNYQDDYYDWDREYNFRDRDVLIAGPEARAMAANFDAFWHARRSVPAERLNDVGRTLLREGVPTLPPASFRRPERVQRVSAEANDMDFVSRSFVDTALPVASVRYVADLPRKHRREKADAPLAGQHVTEPQLDALIAGAQEEVILQTPYLVLSKPAQKLFRELRKRPQPPRVVVSSNSLAATDNPIVYALSYKYKRRNMRELGFNIFEYKPFPLDAPVDYRNLLPDPIAAPGGDDDGGRNPLIGGSAAGSNAGDSRDRDEHPAPTGKQLAVNPRTGSAYQNARERRRAAGSEVETRLLRTETRPSFLGSKAVNKPLPVTRKGARMGLHAKSLVVDRRIGVVGTHNFDPRSENYNTEGAVIIDDPAFAEQLAESILRDIHPQNSWTVAPRAKPPVLSGLNYSVGKASEALPILDFWPWRYATDYEFKPGPDCPRPLPRQDPDFHRCYVAVGDFPEVNVGPKWLLVRMLTAFGAGLVPIL
ncbi:MULTISPECIES: phospholipase D family protein [Stenotrophomonas]|uniref:phospholipase D family protein n=1 Tax=Stenotrophomonas TaxID=40323 RepID=UPI0006580E6F|nr:MULTISPECIES: phospholipase D family protein [Stenotrophomonas maltophilia group]CRQ77704.1 Cardiolipin synthase [Pseudomonas aeruginosa]MBA0227707.1 phospholipase D family protein [Stenotrophomonas maltophilia]MBA0272716.1 phospholipase D family protein [Stenotrophomonas maltophilia]MBA0368717.1 phospholipase D family protein [Stenotrophomonas maltophilia]MBA0406144.1 phospholipase D family protein [Stenotrophomonas maltophilia]